MELNMSKITKKGQITIPKEIRNKFGFLPGTDVDIIAEGNEAYIVKSRRTNIFLQWLGRGKQREKKDIDFMVDKLRGRIDE
jgi:AbrB family looped-hinge helix DNA binding protein